VLQDRSTACLQDVQPMQANAKLHSFTLTCLVGDVQSVIQLCQRLV
jgi:hypothetical protein